MLWATTTAQAAPGTPQPKTMMKRGSRMMLQVRAKARITVGMRLSPKALTILVTMSRKKGTTSRPKMMLIKA